MEETLGNYVISDEASRLQVDVVHGYLTRSYWSENIPAETVQRALSNSLCVGAYGSGGEQVGLIRVISDYATFAYLCDVFVLETHRKRGLSKAMMSFTLRHPRLQGLRTWNLRTQDAHGLYAQFGFTPIENPTGYMILRHFAAYPKPGKKVNAPPSPPARARPP